MEETLKLRQTKLGPEHSDTLSSMNTLANAYRSAGQLDRALPLSEETLKLKQAKLGPEHPDTLTSKVNLALAYQSAGQLDRALPLLEEALTLMQAKLGPQHPHTLTSMGFLAEAYLVAKQFDQALPLVEAYMGGQRRQLAKDPVRLGGLLATVSLNLLKHGLFAAAETYLRECLAIRQEKLPDDWSLFNAKSLLGGALAGQKKFAEAQPLLIEGYEGMKVREAQIPPAGKIYLTAALERLVDLHTAWDKPEEAAKWRTQLEAAAAKTP